MRADLVRGIDRSVRFSDRQGSCANGTVGVANPLDAPRTPSSTLSRRVFRKCPRGVQFAAFLASLMITGASLLPRVRHDSFMVGEAGLFSAIAL